MSEKPKAKRAKMDLKSINSDSVVSDADNDLWRRFLDLKSQNYVDICMSGGIFHWYNHIWGKLTCDSWPPRMPYLEDLWPRFLHHENQNTVEISMDGGVFHRYNILNEDPSLWERLADDLWQRFLHYLNTEEMKRMGDNYRWYSNMWKKLPDDLWARFIHYEYLNTVEIMNDEGSYHRYSIQNKDPSLWERLPDDLWARFLHYLNTVEISKIKTVDTVRWDTNCMWGNLPDEVWLKFLGYLGTVDISMVGATSHRFNILSKDVKLWEKLEFDIANINASLEAVKGVVERATKVKEIKFTNQKMEEFDDMAVASLLSIAKETLKILIFSPEVKLKNEAVMKFDCLTKLEVLDFSYYTLKSTGVNAIAKLKKLKELKIPILDEDLFSWTDSIMLEIEEEINLTPLFTDLKNLVVVDLTYIPITDATLSLLARNNPNLEHLNITTFSILDRDWPSLQVLAQNCPNLWYLDLTGHISMSGDSFNAVAQCKNLQHLVLESCFALNDITLQNIAKNNPKLKHVNLEFCTDVKDSGVKTLAQNCPNLEFLNLDGCSGVKDGGVRALAQNCPNLQYISICDCKTLSKEVLYAVLMACKQLTYIGICKSRKISTKFVKGLEKKYPKIVISDF